MTLRDRAATVLDLTGAPAIAYRGPMTMKLRWLVACWLDGQKVRVSTIRKSVDFLEMVARNY